MDYSQIRIVHEITVLLSFLGFFARGLGRLSGASWIDARAVRVLPHVVDTVLLLSGVTLAWMMHASPTTAPWLVAKIVGLVIYILLGTVAIKRERSDAVRLIAWLAAMVTFGYIVSVAMTKNPWGFLSVLR